MPTPAIFLDRDGTLIHDPGYLGDPALVRVLAGVPEALRILKGAGFRNVIITNQSGIARGYFTEDDFCRVQASMLECLGPDLIDATYFCPDHSALPSERRKPSPAMVLEAASDLELDLSRSWFVGDKGIDIECGQRAGIRSILVLTGQGTAEDGRHADFIANDLAAAAAHILQHADASP